MNSGSSRNIKLKKKISTATTNENIKITVKVTKSQTLSPWAINIFQIK